MKAKSKSQKRMTETAAKELEKQELRHNSDQSTGTPVEVTPEKPEAPVEIISDPGEDAIDKAVREQQALLDARNKKEADEAAEAEIAAHEAEEKAKAEAEEKAKAEAEEKAKAEAEEKAKAEAHENFTFTAFIQFKHYVKVTAGTEEEALEKISQLKLGDYISKKDVRLDKKK